MAAHIPFVNTDADCKLVHKYYFDSAICRVPLDRVDSLSSQLGGLRLWVDPAVDGLHHVLKAKGGNVKTPWHNYFSQFKHHERLEDPTFVTAPKPSVVLGFVQNVLDKAASFDPDWMSVPQLPMVDGTGRNKINRHLADATANWRSESRFKGKLILPVVFTHQRQLSGKTARNPKVNVVQSCYDRSGADGVWIVDCMLTDDSGSRTNRNRFPNLVSLHEELAAKLDASATTIAGPYWGMNTILWARGLADHPAISVGRAYRYHIPGRPGGKRAKTRVAIPPIRRRAVKGKDLPKWLGKAIEKLAREDPAREALEDLKNNLGLLDDKMAREQIARFYKEWLDKIEACPVPARAHALFQDFSSAYVLGKGLPELPQTEKPGTTSPARVAEDFMMSCL